MHISRLQVLVASLLLLILTYTRLRWSQVSEIVQKYTPTESSSHLKPLSQDGQPTWEYPRDRNRLQMPLDQCDAAFPGLFKEIERAQGFWRATGITKEDLDSAPVENGYTRAMIYDNQLYIINKEGSIYSREQATMHAIHRAVLTSPEPLPNIEFAIYSADIAPLTAAWAYCRRAEQEKLWLVPFFGHWSWPETLVGSMNEVSMKAEDEETAWSWSKKIPKLFWRGNIRGDHVRENLMNVATDKPWADVKSLDWHNFESMHQDRKSMHEHCDYKYIMHTEGDSYSGRLSYLQHCRSVVVAHALEWIEYHHSLMHASGPEQNYVQVQRSLDDLEETIATLEGNSTLAEQIAENNIKTFRERYMTRSAEACYWRKLIHAWSEVSFKPEFYKTDEAGKKVWRGLPVESWFLERRLEWEPY